VAQRTQRKKEAKIVVFIRLVFIVIADPVRGKLPVDLKEPMERRGWRGFRDGRGNRHAKSEPVGFGLAGLEWT
jgi:hypothetical protein